MPKQLTRDELKLDPTHYPTVNKWLARGDGIAVYENSDLGHPELGHRQFLSVGSPACTFECSAEELPQRLPDFPQRINWRYQLVGVYQGEQLS